MKENLELPPEAIMELERGNIIAAIKYVRAVHNMGLKEAKDAVDLCLANNPAIKQHMSSVQSENNSRAFSWLIVVAGLGLAAFLFWKFF